MLYFLVTPRPPSSTLFPYTTLFRSGSRRACDLGSGDDDRPTVFLGDDGDRDCCETDRARRNGNCRRWRGRDRSEEHTSELQSQSNLVCRLLLEKKKSKRRHQSQV